MQWELLPGRSRSRPVVHAGGSARAGVRRTRRQLRLGRRRRPAVADDAQRHRRGRRRGVADRPRDARAAQRPAGRARPGRPGGAGRPGAVRPLPRRAAHRRADARVDLATGVVTAIDAGSPRMVLLRAGEVSDLPLEPQLPLGMFDGTDYRPQTFALTAGDRLFIVSDGVYEAASDKTGLYGDTALARFVRRSHAAAPARRGPRPARRPARLRGRRPGRRRRRRLPRLERLSFCASLRSAGLAPSDPPSSPCGRRALRAGVLGLQTAAGASDLRLGSVGGPRRARPNGPPGRPDPRPARPRKLP